MSNLQIKQLYNHKRSPDAGLYLLVYLPFGLLLFIIRSLVGLIVVILGYTLPNTEVAHNILFKLVCFSLGISVNIKNNDKKEDVDVYISNCLSHFDHLAVHAATKAVMPGGKMMSLLSKALGMHYFGSISNMEAFKKNVSELISEKKIPVYFRPEAKLTNGKGLLKFKEYPFSFSSKIQPICIEVCRPFLDISVNTLGSTYWQNVFFFMFSPCTIYTLKFLPALEKKNLSDAEFAEIVRQNIGAALKVEMTNYSSSDLLEWEKRILAEQRNERVRQTNVGGEGRLPEIHCMALQIQEVLPDVPYYPIYRDLLKTKNVDQTITNILEGRVQYTPISRETKPATPKTSPASSASTSQPQNNSMIAAASTFGKTAHERNLSFQERKKLLIENARRRYIEKHNLNITLNNC